MNDLPVTILKVEETAEKTIYTTFELECADRRKRTFVERRTIRTNEYKPLNGDDHVRILESHTLDPQQPAPYLIGMDDVDDRSLLAELLPWVTATFPELDGPPVERKATDVCWSHGPEGIEDIAIKPKGSIILVCYAVPRMVPVEETIERGKAGEVITYPEYHLALCAFDFKEQAYRTEGGELITKDRVLKQALVS